MHESLTRFIPEMIGRIDGPMKFRLLVQPCMALLFAVRDGRRDARAGRPPFLFALLTDPKERPLLLREGWRGIANVFVLAAVLDVVYQFIEIKGFRPLQVLATATLLALLPYLLMRGVANRLVRRLSRGASSDER